MMINKFVNDFIIMFVFLIISSNCLNTRTYLLNILLIFQMKKHVDFKHNWKYRRNIYIRFSNQSNKSVKVKFALYSHFYFTDFFLNPPGCWVSQKSSGKKKEKRKEGNLNKLTCREQFLSQTSLSNNKKVLFIISMINK